MVDDDLAAGGVRYERVRPMQEWRLTAEGDVSIRDRDGRGEPRTARLALDVTFAALMAPVGTDGQGRAGTGASAATGQSVGKGLERRFRHLHHLDPFLRKPVKLTADGVEFTVGRHEARPGFEREGGEKADEELVRVGAEGDLRGGLAEEARETGFHRACLLERLPPLVVHQLRGVPPRLGLRGKTVLPLLTGGTLAHVLALDYALRPVLQSLVPRLVVSGLFVLDKLIELRDGEVTLAAELVPRLDEVVQTFGRALHCS
jgi:hypothetical protein